nr:hypothetical protein [Tanacetum cinerariifolium]
MFTLSGVTLDPINAALNTTTTVIVLFSTIKGHYWRLDSLPKRETDESTGKVSVHVIANSGHYIYKDQPRTLLQIMTPKISSLA